METFWIKILSYLAVALAGGWGGYILKDVLTIEKKIDVTINKPKIKGDGSSIDIDQDVQVDERKLTFRERIEAKREKRKERKNKS